MTKSLSDKNSSSDRILDIIEKRNLAQFGDPQGPSPDQLHALGKSWEQILQSSCNVAGEGRKFLPERMKPLKKHYDLSECLFYILFEESDSDPSYVNIFYGCIKEKYPIVATGSMKLLSDEYLLVVTLNEYSFSLHWHYAIGLTLRAENPESNDIVIEIAHYVDAELKKLKD